MVGVDFVVGIGLIDVISILVLVSSRLWSLLLATSTLLINVEASLLIITGPLVVVSNAWAFLSVPFLDEILLSTARDLDVVGVGKVGIVVAAVSAWAGEFLADPLLLLVTAVTTGAADVVLVVGLVVGAGWGVVGSLASESSVRSIMVRRRWGLVTTVLDRVGGAVAFGRLSVWRSPTGVLGVANLSGVGFSLLLCRG